MSSNTRVTRSKGKSDGLSLPARTRPRRKSTNKKNDEGDTVLNTTFDADSGQHHPQTPVHTSPLRCQFTPPWTDAVRMQETPVPAVPAASHRPMTPHIPLPRSQGSNTSLSTMSGPSVYRRQMQFHLQWWRGSVRCRSHIDKQMKQTKPDIHDSLNRRKANLHTIHNGLHHPGWSKPSNTTCIY